MTTRSSPEAGEPVATNNRLPDTPVQKWVRPFVAFLEIESASGVVLLICILVALVLANSLWSAQYAEFWHTPIVIGIGSFASTRPLDWWVNDALMTIFFFVVGLEIKRELVAGELREFRKAALPILAALGGMIAPASIYLLLQGGQTGERGWGIPMATDIAFVVGFLALLGPRVPLGLKILLLSLAIADDIGAVLVIAVFYSNDISMPMLGLAGAGFAVTYFFNLIGVRRVPIYIVVGAFIWLAFLNSGVHPTITGVLLGLLTPASAWVGDRSLIDIVGDVWHSLRTDADGQPEYHHQPLLEQLETAAHESTSPLERLETGLHPWVAFGIMPVFALANAGVSIDVSAVTHPIAFAVACGLILGKPLGILVFSGLGVALGLAKLPTGVNWPVMLGAGCLAGIGFTMSLFVANLALTGPLLDAGKLGTLLGSAVSAVLGCVLLLLWLPASTDAPASSERCRPDPEQ